MHIFKLTILTTLLSSSLQAQAQTTDRMIIKYKDEAILNNITVSTLAQSLPQTISSSVRMNIIRVNTFSANIVKVNIAGKKPSLAQMKRLAKELSKRSDIEYAEPDYIMRPLQVPNDTDYASEHWHYRDTPGGANLEGAWDITTGSDSDIIAVIDTGILPHIELISKTLPGYDFIADSVMGNDGDGRDDNATDSGDWCHEGDDCYVTSDDYSNSSWHGTHVSGTIAAKSNNEQGMAGINWEGKILPVRVLGKGGGWSSDIAEGMLWAAGIHVDGVPDNPNPAKVLNLSLGGSGDCSQTYLDTIDQINTTGAVIVIAAGNSNIDVSNSSPGNCPGVITVAASSEDGSRAYYSNYGALIDITAPGGDKYKDSKIYSTLDGGATTPNNDNIYAYYQGTSMATPHIAGIASLITNLLPEADYTLVNYILQETARTFPITGDNDCNTDICGAGIVDATAALEYTNNHTEAKYINKIYRKIDEYLYTFSSDKDKIDSSSLWFIDQEQLTSNGIEHNQATSYQINLTNIDLYDISFDWGISSEVNYDYLIFSAEGSKIFAVSGEETNFYNASNIDTIDNELNLDWIYMKDGAVIEGDDKAWIDNIAITTYKTTTSVSFSKNCTGKMILITNSGFDPLAINSPALSDSTNFTLVNKCLQSLNFQESCNLIIEYTGSFNTEDTTTLSYDTSDSTMPHIEKVFDVKDFNVIIPIVNYLLF